MSQTGNQGNFADSRVRQDALALFHKFLLLRAEEVMDVVSEMIRI